MPTKVVALRPFRYKGKAKSARAKRVIRHIRVRRRVYGAPERPRMAVFRSSNHISVQIIRNHEMASCDMIKRDGDTVRMLVADAKAVAF